MTKYTTEIDGQALEFTSVFNACRDIEQLRGLAMGQVRAYFVKDGSMTWEIVARGRTIAIMQQHGEDE